MLLSPYAWIDVNPIPTVISYGPVGISWYGAGTSGCWATVKEPTRPPPVVSNMMQRHVAPSVGITLW